MDNTELEARINRAFSNAAPDDFDAILADCRARSARGPAAGKKPAHGGKTGNSWARRAAGLAAVLVLIMGGFFGFSAYRANFAVDSTVSLDVNPSIEIQVNQREKVLAVVPLNEDGGTVLGSMDLKGSGLEVAVNALIGSMLRNGYLSDIANSILVSVDNKDPAKGAEMQKRLAEEITSLLQTDTFSGAVLSQTIRQDSSTQELAEQYGITLGKAQLIQQIVGQSPRYAFADLVPLSINELNLIGESGNVDLGNVESVGTASEKSYIGEARAREAALAHAQAAASDILNYRCEMDFERGAMVYEIEFSCGGYEYEYDIDAVTGAVLWSGKELDDDHPAQPQSTPVPVSTPTPEPETYGIGQLAAMDIAFARAGITQDRARNIKCTLEKDNGSMMYEVEFDCDGYEYEYDIDADSGAVIWERKEVDDDLNDANDDRDDQDDRDDGGWDDHDDRDDDDGWDDHDDRDDDDGWDDQNDRDDDDGWDDHDDRDDDDDWDDHDDDDDDDDDDD